MIVQKDFISKLRDFGLNTYEGKLWTALLSRGISTAGELSDIANVPRSRSYDVLESLEKKGFIVMKIGKPIKYIAVPPEEVLERVKKKIVDETEKHTKLLNELKKSAVLSELNILHSQGVDLVEPADLTGALKGRENIYNHLESEIKNAKKSITIATSDEGLLRKSTELRRALVKASANNVKIRIAAPFSGDVKQIKELSKLCEIRKDDTINGRFCIVDKSKVTFMLMDDKSVHPSYDAGVWVNTDLFAKSLEKMFDSIWAGMKTQF